MVCFYSLLVIGHWLCESAFLVRYVVNMDNMAFRRIMIPNKLVILGIVCRKFIPQELVGAAVAFAL